MDRKSTKYPAIGQAVVAAALFGISAPVSKLILEHISPYMLSSLLYFGAGLGMLLVGGFRKIMKVENKEAKLSRKELPYIVLMVLIDTAAPILLLLGLKTTTASSASLLYNFEIVATAVIALLVFRENVGKRLWIAIIIITVSSMILSVSDIRSLSFSPGAILVLLGCISWGLENNVTRKLSIKDPLHVALIKGFGAGTGALVVALLANGLVWDAIYVIAGLVLGFFAYGISVFLYITAQRSLGAARTSSYYAVAPFIGAILSFILFSDQITIAFAIAFLLMIIGVLFAISEKHTHPHSHPFLVHDHKHSHDDGHHFHTHEEKVTGEHSHPHTHQPLEHTHEHTPDIHHTHSH